MVSGGTADMSSSPDDPEPSTVEIYDPASDAWSEGPAHTRRLDEHHLLQTSDGRVVALGDGFVEVLDVDAAAWRRAADAPVTTFAAAGVPLPAGRFALVGGRAATTSASHADAVLVFDPATERVTELPPLPGPRVAHAATALAIGDVLVCGGFGEPGVIADGCVVVDTDGDARAEVPGAAFKGAFTAACRLGDDAVLLSGGMEGYEILDAVFAYVPASNRLLRVGDLSTPRTAHTCIARSERSALVAAGTLATGLERTETEVVDVTLPP